VVATGDLNGDSKSDLIWYRAATGATYAWLMNGTTPLSGGGLLTDPAWSLVAVGDLNADRKSDLIWFHATTGTTYAWLMNGTTPLSGAGLLTDPAWNVVATGDLNGDNRSDLIWHHALSGTTYAWLMNGTSPMSGGSLLTDPAWVVVATADLNGDGNSDIIWYRAATGTTYAWLMNGTSPASGGGLLNDPSWKVIANTPSEGRVCGSFPRTSNRQLSLWTAPFQGSFRLSNYFDHDYPLLSGDTNNYQLSPCGERVTNRSTGHAGIDYSMPVGTPIFAVADGLVTFAGLETPHSCSVMGGQFVRDSAIEIKHPSSGGEQFGSRYVHLSVIDVQAGQAVTRGQQIGLSGNVGCSSAPHLHLAAWRFFGSNGRTSIDPYGWEGAGPDPWAAHPQGAASVWLWKPGQAPGILP
jgi:murein DD-endopeptidase MepM/ murein hydrolase activator NlpD